MRREVTRRAEMGSHGLAWAHTAAALRRDADEGLDGGRRALEDADDEPHAALAAQWRERAQRAKHGPDEDQAHLLPRNGVVLARADVVGWWCA